ncbi:aureochrome 4 [Tribonema minus]|uniref:Aureochrome 4 n=1 Tax=Tribonema minus TaxID=303371 RepID=A0A836CJE1_9STRA|nr:aureochrome 4 [Tribonema minus]
MYSFSSGIGKSGKDLSEQQKIERRERNREHAKRSRVRKKFMLECLQEQLLALRKENMNLRQAVQEHMPDVATDIFTKVVSERALVLSGDAGSTPQQQAQTSRKPNCLLVEPDFQLISALMDSQQNFAVSDPSLPDNPIVYASQGFLNLTGYTIDKVIGRNCRFLQGPGTDPRAVDIIRRGVSEGRDTSVCLLNYKADGSPFWNNFFISALRDQNGVVVNFVGVQAEVKQAPPEDFKEKLRKIPLPDDMLNDDDS